jgi:glutamine synthetase
MYERRKLVPIEFECQDPNCGRVFVVRVPYVSRDLSREIEERSDEPSCTPWIAEQVAVHCPESVYHRVVKRNA